MIMAQLCLCFHTTNFSRHEQWQKLGVNANANIFWGTTFNANVNANISLGKLFNGNGNVYSFSSALSMAMSNALPQCQLQCQCSPLFKKKQPWQLGEIDVNNPFTSALVF